MRIRTNLVAAALGTLLLATASACAGADGADAGKGADAAANGSLPEVKADPEAVKLLPADLQKGGTITMAADLHYPPTSFLAEDNKTPIGYNVDIAHLLGEKLGLEVQVKNVTWDGVIPGIAAKRYDFTATNMSPTPERLEVLNMITYWSAGSSLIVAKGNPLDLGLADQSTCGHKIAVMAGSTQQETYLPEISADCQAAGEDAVEAVVLPNVQGALTQLSSKRIDGVFSDTSQLGWAAKQQPQAFELRRAAVPEEGRRLHRRPRRRQGFSADRGAARRHAVPDRRRRYQEALDRWGLGTGAIPTSTCCSSDVRRHRPGRSGLEVRRLGAWMPPRSRGCTGGARSSTSPGWSAFSCFVLVAKTLLTNENYQWDVVWQYFTASDGPGRPAPHDHPDRPGHGHRGAAGSGHRGDASLGDAAGAGCWLPATSRSSVARRCWSS